MKNFFFFLFLCNLTYGSAITNDPIIITEQTIKINGNKDFFFSLAEGDVLVFDLKVIKGKSLKEVEILEYPRNSKLSEFKTKEISNKKININKTSVYRFRIKSGGMMRKICKIKISRIPKSTETNSFNTSVEWTTVIDSTFTKKTRMKLVKTDTVAIDFLDKIERVHSNTNLSNTNRSQFAVELPKNKRTELSTSEVISWAYWIGVGDEGLQAYEKEKKKYLLNNTAKVGSLVNPMAGLALGAYAVLSNPPSGDNVKYWFTGVLSGQQIVLTSGNSISAFGRDTKNLQGGFTVVLENDNIMDGINVSIKMTAVLVNKKYVVENYEELSTKVTKVPVLRKG